MMQCYAIVKEGVCKQVFCSDDSMLPIAEEGSQLIKVDGLVDADMLYIKDGVLLKKPEKPSEIYEWDAQNFTWVPNQRLAIFIVKNKRNQLLQESDWTQLADIPQETKDRWEPYRQALRDVTTQPGYPLEIVWPTPPQ